MQVNEASGKCLQLWEQEDHCHHLVVTIRSAATFISHHVQDFAGQLPGIKVFLILINETEVKEKNV